MSINSLSPTVNESSNLPIICFTPDEEKDSKIDTNTGDPQIPKSVEPIRGRGVVRERQTISRLNMARTTSTKDLKNVEFKPCFAPEENKDSRVDVKVSHDQPFKIIEPMKNEGVVRTRHTISPLNIAYASSREDMEHAKPNLKNRIRKTSGSRLRSKDTLDKDCGSYKFGHMHGASKDKRNYTKSDGSKSDRTRHTHSGDPNLIRPISVPFSTFIKAIDVPVISYEKWNENLRRFIVCQVLDSEFSDDKLEQIEDYTYSVLLTLSSILKRIERAKTLLFGVHLPGYLKINRYSSNPMHFFKSYVNLKNESFFKSKEFYEIIGKEEALKILKAAAKPNDQAMRRVIQSEIDLVTCVEKKRNLLLKSSFYFSKDFDKENLHIVSIPIYLLEYREFEESFRWHITDGPFSEDCIRFNGVNLIIPNYRELGIREKDRIDYFLSWLVSEVQMIMAIKSSHTVEQQLKLFAQDGDDDSILVALKLKVAISGCLEEEFQTPYSHEQVPIKLENCLKKLRSKKKSKDFADQMLLHIPFITKYLMAQESFKAADWNTVSSKLKSLWHRFYLLEKKQKIIPLLPLLKSMCYSTYSTGELFQRTTLCPKLSNLGASSYHLELEHGVMTRYDICEYFGNFQVTHIKMFNIVSDGKVKANVEVRWTPKGKLGSIEYSSSFELAKLDYLPDCSYEERKVISDQFHLDCEDSKWGSYLYRS